MQRFQSFQFELRPNGQQQRQMRCFARVCRFVFNKALAFKRHEQRLKRYQRCMSRKQRGSKNWHKSRHRVQKIHTQIANARNDFLHKASTALSKAHAMIVVEDLAVRNMSKYAAGTAQQHGNRPLGRGGCQTEKTLLNLKVPMPC